MERIKYNVLVDRPFGYWTLEEDDFKRFKWWMTHDVTHDPEPYTPLVEQVDINHRRLRWLRP